MFFYHSYYKETILSRFLLAALLVLFISGCKEENIVYPSPGINISSAEIKSLVNYDINVKIDLGEGQIIQKAELILEDITVSSESDIVKEIQLTKEQSQEHIVAIETDRLSHDYRAKAILHTNKYTYTSEAKIIRSLKNNFSVQLMEDEFYPDPMGEIGVFQNPGQSIVLFIDYLNVYNPKSVEVKLNGKIKVESQLSFESPTMGGGYIRSSGNFKLPEDIVPGSYEVGVFIDGIEFKATKKVQVMKGLWQTVEKNYPGEHRGEYAWFVLGDNLYVVGGSFLVTAINFSPVWEYNIKTKIWTQKKNFPYPFDLQEDDYAIKTKILPFQIQSGGNGYVLMQFGQTIELWKYNPAEDSWKTISKYPGKGEVNLTGFMLMDKLYIGGGLDNEFFQFGSKLMNDFWCYDFVANTWTRKNDLPFDPIIGRFPSCSLKNKGFVLQANRYFWEYDADKDLWSQIKQFPGPWRFSSQLLSDGSNVYLVGGEGEEVGVFYYIKAYKDCWKYSPEIDSWEMQAFMPYYSSNGIAFLYQGKLITGLGYLIESSYKWDYYGRMLYEFTPSTN